MVSVANELKNVVIGYASNPQIFCDFWYTWAEQCVTLPRWKYKLQVWWAWWWSCNDNCKGKWWYSEWCITLPEETTLYVYVWWQWSRCSWWWYVVNWWWNGWGNARVYSKPEVWSWWWWTDIRIWWNTLYHRRIVAWGWWGGWNADIWQWFWWGWCCWLWCWTWSWIIDYTGYRSGVWPTYWSQTSPWDVHAYSSWEVWSSVAASFWQWWYMYANCTSNTSTWWWWGWWYWWWVENHKSWWWWSWYTYNSSTCWYAPNWYCHCTKYFLTNWISCCWNQSFPSPDWNTETWHSWNGCVKISSV